MLLSVFTWGFILFNNFYAPFACLDCGSRTDDFTHTLYSGTNEFPKIGT